MNNQKLDEVRRLILALLVSRKGATAVPLLERDYYDMEKTRIPYRQFGYSNLVEFLQSSPEHFVVEQYNGGHYVRGISERSRHVSSLVSRQRMSQPSRPPRYIPPHLRPPFNRRPHHYARPVQQIHISPATLSRLVQYIKDHPNGVSMQDAVTVVQQSVPFVNISAQQLRGQLQLLSHQLRLDGNMIFPIWNNDSHNAAQQQQLLTEEPQLPRKSLSDSESLPIPNVCAESLPIPNVCAAGQEDYVDSIEYFSDDDDFLPADSASNCQRRAETNGEINDREAFAMMNGNGSTEMRTADVDISQLINDRIKLRLEELMRKHPDGIWCAELPNLYLREYKVRLNYNQLGFASVREFTSYLPQIFYMTQVNKTDDFMLYSADKRPVVPKTEPIDIARTSRNRCSNDEDNAPIPADVSPTITRNFAPNDVMNYDDKVDKLSVGELKRNRKYLEVYIIEVFHPSFFWIHLRENIRHFTRMMDELSEFYECNKSKYTIAKIALRKDLNCACIFDDRWHRAVIRSVKPDFRVTVLFYDYGTMKTYAPEDVYYLHKQFSFLPAQAIPCGLYNVKPSIGDRWKRSVVDKFIDKIAETLLAATIVTIDPEYNSMMVILTDTSEEEDVRINDWLVNERLAQVGKTVRMLDIVHYMTCDNIKSSRSIKTFNAGSAVNKSRRRNNSISRNERTHRLSDVKSEDIENNTVKSSHDVPNSKKALLAHYAQRLRSKSPDAKSLHDKSSSAKSLNAKSPDTKALDTRSQSRNYPQTGQSRTPTKVPSLEKLKTLSHNQKSDSEPSTSASGTNTDEDNARQIDSSRKVKLQNNSEIYNSPGYMDFSMRDSDDENNDTKDFGTFRSLYGGCGLMEPFDWSLIREENKITDTIPDNLDMSSKEHKSDVEDKSGSHNQRNEIPGKQYFLNVTCMEEEIFLPEDNIDEKFDDGFDFIKTMRDPNQIVRVMFKPNDKLKTLHDSVESEDTSKSSTNIIEFNDVASSREMNQEVDRNGKVCETKANQKIQNKNSNTDSESVCSNTSNNEDNMNKEMSGRNTNNSLESDTNNKECTSRYKMLLGRLSRKWTNSNFVDASESSSSEQIRSSSYSANTSNDTIISSNDEQSKASNCMDINNRIKIHSLVKKSTSEELPKKLTLDESHNDSTVTTLSSIETDSLASSNVDDIKQRQLNQSLEIDSIASNVDDTKQHQLNHSDSIPVSCNIDDSKNQLHAADQTALNVPKLMQQMFKIVKNIENNNTELDSDDLSSSRESINDDKSDESKRDNESIKSDFVSETCKSMNDDANVTEIAFAPVVNDCDVESDESEWDVCAGSIEDSISFLHRAHNISNAIK